LNLTYIFHKFLPLYFIKKFPVITTHFGNYMFDLQEY